MLHAAHVGIWFLGKNCVMSAKWNHLMPFRGPFPFNLSVSELLPWKAKRATQLSIFWVTKRIKLIILHTGFNVHLFSLGVIAKLRKPYQIADNCQQQCWNR